MVSGVLEGTWNGERRGGPAAYALEIRARPGLEIGRHAGGFGSVIARRGRWGGAAAVPGRGRRKGKTRRGGAGYHLRGSPGGGASDRAFEGSKSASEPWPPEGGTTNGA